MTMYCQARFGAKVPPVVACRLPPGHAGFHQGIPAGRLAEFVWRDGTANDPRPWSHPLASGLANLGLRCIEIQGSGETTRTLRAVSDDCSDAMQARICAWLGHSTTFQFAVTLREPAATKELA